MLKQLDAADVAEVLALVSKAGDPTESVSLSERKHSLVSAVSQLINADFWCWSIGIHSDDLKESMSNSWMDGGFSDDAEKLRFMTILSSGEFAAAVNPILIEIINNNRYITYLSQEIFAIPQVAAVEHLWNSAGFGHNILSTYALQPGVCSGIGLHRRYGNPPFTERDRTIVHLVFQQVEWLHRDNAKIPINRTLLNLSQRERQVLIFLMGGDSTKQVAKRLNLSHHTVGDYVKSIYRQLGVNSRSELLSHFISGGQRQG
jgi:DNA-binding CsgD family transcriptional regulator